MKARMTVEFDVLESEVQMMQQRLGRNGIHPETYLAMANGPVYRCEFVFISQPVETDPEWLGYTPV